MFLEVLRGANSAEMIERENVVIKMRNKKKHAENIVISYTVNI